MTKQDGFFGNVRVVFPAHGKPNVIAFERNTVRKRITFNRQTARAEPGFNAATGGGAGIDFQPSARGFSWRAEAVEAAGITAGLRINEIHGSVGYHWKSAIVHVRLARVVYGVGDPKGGGAGGAINLLQFPSFNHKCEITRGVRETECRSLLQSFFAEQRAKAEKSKDETSTAE